MKVVIDGREYVPADAMLYRQTEELPDGNICPSCGRDYSAVVSTREKSGKRIRRRECIGCSTRWNTIEVRI